MQLFSVLACLFLAACASLYEGGGWTADHSERKVCIEEFDPAVPPIQIFSLVWNSGYTLKILENSDAGSQKHSGKFFRNLTFFTESTPVTRVLAVSEEMPGQERHECSTLKEYVDAARYRLEHPPKKTGAWGRRVEEGIVRMLMMARSISGALSESRQVSESATESEEQQNRNQ